jgi:hypothetical protein
MAVTFPLDRFWRKAVLFADGANGMKIQGFEYHYGTGARGGTGGRNGKPPKDLIKTDVVETATKPDRAAAWSTTYKRGDVEYPTLQAALEAWLDAQEVNDDGTGSGPPAVSPEA